MSCQCHNKAIGIRKDNQLFGKTLMNVIKKKKMLEMNLNLCIFAPIKKSKNG